MSDHDLRRSADNEPVCACGYRPEILDDWRPWSNRQTKARTAVLDHAQELNRKEATSKPADIVRFAEAALGVEVLPWQVRMLQRAFESPFVVTESTRYPRAGVRRLPTGEWKLTLWDEPDVVHACANESVSLHPDRYSACLIGETIIGAHRQSGTRLNGMAR
jgi:hypothetical protein